MKNIKLTLSVGFMLTGMLAFFSCEKFVAVENPPHLMVKDRVFEDERSATAAVLAIYSDLSGITSYFNGNMQVMAALNADELSYADNDLTFIQFMDSEVLQTNGPILSLWNELYQCVYRANAVVEGLAAAESLPMAVKQQLRGEALLVRALCYVYLVELYGDVPLITETAYEVNQTKGRERVDVVYESVFADLLEAWELLPPEPIAAERTRPDRYAAAALLARAYLYSGDWPEARRFADEVIASPQYTMVGPDMAFRKSSPATIFQLRPVYSTAGDNNTNIGRIFIPGATTTIPSFYVNEAFLNAFEAGDYRRKEWLAANTVNGTAYSYPFKYQVRYSEEVEEYLVLFRLSEVLLIRAEARLHENNTEGAIADVNTVRKYANLPQLPLTLSAEKAMQAIRRERRIELAFEWCHRWLDLKRWGLSGEVLAPLKGANWSDTDVLWPIPFSELQANPALTPNDGQTN